MKCDFAETADTEPKDLKLHEQHDPTLPYLPLWLLSFAKPISQLGCTLRKVSPKDLIPPYAQTENVRLQNYEKRERMWLEIGGVVL